jgi:hypothetical protein
MAVVEGVVTRRYKFLHYGESYYICIPKPIIVTLDKKILEKGAVMRVLELSKDKVVIQLSVNDEGNGKYSKSDKRSGKDP